MRTLLLMLKKKDWGLLLEFARKDSCMICTGIRLFVCLVYEQGMLNNWYTKGTEKMHQHLDKYHCSPFELITLKRTNTSHLIYDSRSVGSIYAGLQLRNNELWSALSFKASKMCSDIRTHGKDHCSSQLQKKICWWPWCWQSIWIA